MERAVCRPMQRWRRTNRPHRRILSVALAMLLASEFCAAADAPTPPLHERIDQLLAESSAGVAAPIVGDAEFLRRVSLDLIGVPPAVDELRAFLADQNPAKREAAVDRLLNHPRYARHMAEVFDVMLMERRPNVNVTADEWHQYLLKAFRENRPYNALAKEILEADGAEPKPRAAVRFYLDRQADPNLLTRDVGRIFFGRDLQCAQCHDHPLVLDYHQADYHGLRAFFSAGSAFVAPAPDGKTYYVEKAGGRLTFESVFVPGKHTTGPKLLGLAAIEEPALYPDELYVVKPADNVRPTPKFSRLAKLAEMTTDGTNRAFNENIANRLWAHLMGRGLVEPVDLHHNANPPTHPQLLELLTDEFVAMKYDVRAFLRELALSQTYQRSIDLPADFVAQGTALAAQVPALDQQEQQTAAVSKVSSDAASKALEAAQAARATLPPIYEELTKAAQPIAETQKAIDAANKALAEASAKLAPKQDVAKLVVEAAAKAKEASVKLPGEADLVEAAAKFEARSTALNAEVAALTKEVADKTAASKAASDKFATLNTAVDAVQTKIEAARKQLMALEDQHDAAAAKNRADLAATALAKRKAAEAKSLVEAANLGTASQSSQAAAAKLSADLAAAKATLAKLTAELPAMQAAQAAAQKASDDAAAAMTAAKGVLNMKQLAMKEFGEVLAKADAAAQKLTGDAEVAATVQKLKARSETLTAELAAVTKDFAAKDEAAKTAAAKLAAATQVVAATTAQMTDLSQKTPVLEQQVPAATAKAAADAAAFQRVTAEIPERWAKEFATGRVRHLSPEQFAWSVLVVTGVYHNYNIATAAEIEKAKPLTEEAKKDPAQLTARQRELEAAVFAKLAPSVVQFVNLFGNGQAAPQTDFFATVDQALFVANGGTVRSWLAPSGENLTARLMPLNDPKALAEEMYISLFARTPTAAEVAEVTQYLAARPNERLQAVQEMCWGLISSTEFRFNH